MTHQLLGLVEVGRLPGPILIVGLEPGEWIIPQIDRAYRTGEMPPLLPAASQTDPRPSSPIALPPA